MITTIRKSFKSKAYKIILWIVLLGVGGIFSIFEFFKIGTKAAWIAKVNREQVSYADFMRKAEAHQEQLLAFRARYGQSADLLLESMGFSLDPRSFALDAVIQEALLDQEAKKLGVSISSNYVADKLANPLFVREALSDLIPFGALDRSGNINMQALNQYFSHLGLSMADFDAKVVETLQRQLLMQIVAHASYTPEFVLKERFAALYVPKKFSILTLSFADVLKDVKAQPISATELQAFFDQQNQISHRYTVPAKRTGVAWSIDPVKYGVTLTSQDIESYYEDNKAKLFVLEPSKVQVRHILFRVLNESDREAVWSKAKKIRQELALDPAQFATIAATASDDKDTKEKGGLLPAFVRGTKEAAFDKAAFILKEDGDISDVVPVREGYELLQRVEKISATFKSLSAVEKEIKDALMQQKFAELFTKDMHSIIEQSQEQEGKLEELMQEKGAKKQLIAGVARDDKEWGQVLFGLHKKGDADVYIDKGIGFVVQLTGHQENFISPLDSIKDVVEHDFYESKAKSELKAKLQTINEQAKTKSLQELEKEYHGTLDTTPWITKHDEESLSDLKKKGISTDHLFQLEKIGATIVQEGDRDGYVLRLDQVQELDQEVFNEKKNELSGQLTNEEMRLFIVGFVASLFRNAKIETNESINESFSPIQYEDEPL